MDCRFGKKMKKSDSNNKLNNIKEQKLLKAINNREKTLLRRSFSDSLPQTESENGEIAATLKTSPKQKKHLRLSSAFKSLRSIKKSKISCDIESNPNIILSEGSLKSGYQTEKLQKNKSPQKSFFNSLKKKKIKSNNCEILNLSSSETQTSGFGDLGSSNTSILDSSSLCEDQPSPKIKVDKLTKIKSRFIRKKNFKNKQKQLLNITTASPKDNNIPLEAEVIADYIKSDQEKEPDTIINITASTCDTPPQERAPSLPEVISDNKIVKEVNTPVIKSLSILTPVNKPSPLSTSPTQEYSKKLIKEGAIPKNKIKQEFPHQQSNKKINNSENLMFHESNLNRGRRFPRPTTVPSIPVSITEATNLARSLISVSPLKHDTGIQESQHEKQLHYKEPGHTENILLSDPAITKEDSDDEYHPSISEEIELAIGKDNFTRNDNLIKRIPQSSSVESFQSFDNHSPIHENSGARRKIKYIDQATVYTEEEKKILKDKPELRRASLGGISEHSFDSELSFDRIMPAFGDLALENEEAPVMTSSAIEKREHLYKILVIGELGTGKTSFIKRYVHQFFSQNYRATIGVDFALKVLHWDQNTIIRLQLWDIAGQERFGNMTRVYYKEAVGAFIVFDVTRSGTFDAVHKWKYDLDSKVQLPDGSPIPCILLANKCDQDKQGIITTPEKMDEYVKENGFAGWFETSAKENINIEEAARALVNKILLNDKLISASDIIDSEKFALAGGSSYMSSQASKKSCSC